MNGLSLSPIPQLSDFAVEERTPAVELLLGICHIQRERLELLQGQIIEHLSVISSQAEQLAQQGELIKQLRDEVAHLKGEKGRPAIRASTLNKSPGGAAGKGPSRKRGKPGKRKTKKLEIHQKRVIEPAEIPSGSRFKGYEDYVVQDIEICLSNTLYRRARYQTPSGDYILGDLPAEVQGTHFGPVLRSFCLSQYHQQRVPEQLILRQLHEIGVQISSGQLSQILTEGHEAFHEEKEQILVAGLEVSSHVNVDDTGTRHKGKNGFATHIGNELFAWFSSTETKSRINFLELLGCGRGAYVIDDVARTYMEEQKCPKVIAALLTEDTTFSTKSLWEAHLDSLEISVERHRTILSEAALIAGLIHEGPFAELVIVSDDAGQFRVSGFLNALCWIHAERTVNKLIPGSETQREAITLVRGEIWDFYQSLKNYKELPSPEQKTSLEVRFDSIFTQKTPFQSLNLALKRIHLNKDRLLLVLSRPEIPLHNNLSENDIRDYVTKRKVSPTTRSDNGRRARDTFLSLKKTCRKLGISFWEYLKDRIGKTNYIPPLQTIIRTAALQPARAHT
jgi:Transposase IS66 family